MVPSKASKRSSKTLTRSTLSAARSLLKRRCGTFLKRTRRRSTRGSGGMPQRALLSISIWPTMRSWRSCSTSACRRFCVKSTKPKKRSKSKGMSNLDSKRKRESRRDWPRNRSVWRESELARLSGSSARGSRSKNALQRNKPRKLNGWPENKKS